MRKWAYLALSLLIVAAFSIISSCTSSKPLPAPTYNAPPGGIIGHGGVTGPGGMMGSGGMMSPGTPYQGGGARINMDKAAEIVNKYLADRKDPDLKASEIIEFANNFYVGFKERSTGIYAFEALIDPYSGDMYSEPGPNMMWNAKYGMMTGMMWGNLTPSIPMTITEAQAIKNAQVYLDNYLPGTKAGDADRFYGYYTIEILRDGRTYGMLSVNGYTGQVWYHFWHGPFSGLRALE
jgi:hypothetical protein